ncbi:MAG: REP-associated tyrosine transposase [Dehalococcoidia bacterium]
MRYPKSIRRPADHYADRELCFHLTIRAHPKLGAWPGGAGEVIWAAVMEQRSASRVELFAACLMPDHMHLIASPREQDLLRFLDAWKGWTTRLAWKSGNGHGLWQPGMWDRTIEDEEDLVRTAAYVVRNPVTAGLVEDEREWPWSWVWWWDE